MKNQTTCSVILAAGKGTRMKSDTPKVFHKIHEKTLLQHVCDRLQKTGVDHHCIIASGPSDYFEDFHQQNPNYSICFQNQKRGTGDAVASAAVLIQNAQRPDYTDAELWRGAPLHADYTLVCTGDAPAICPSDLQKFMDKLKQDSADIGVLGMNVPEPTGYGRLIKGSDGMLSHIIEEKDASDHERKVTLCNSGIIYARTEILFGLLSSLKPENTQKEYYLTDCFKLARERGHSISLYETDNWLSYLGINTPEQLAQVAETINNEG